MIFDFTSHHLLGQSALSFVLVLAMLVHNIKDHGTPQLPISCRSLQYIFPLLKPAPRIVSPFIHAISPANGSLPSSISFAFNMPSEVYVFKALLPHCVFFEFQSLFFMILRVSFIIAIFFKTTSSFLIHFVNRMLIILL